MPFVAPEDVGTTRRRTLSGRRRLQAWERTAGTCVICGQHIDGVRERWIVEHIRALELGGADDLKNMGPAHEACGREKTRDDHARAAKAKRQKIRYLGAVVGPARPLPGSRVCALKRKVNGTVVLRETHARPRSGAEAKAGQRTAPGPEPKTFAMGSPLDRVVRLCLTPAPSAKENRAGTANQMTKRPTTVKPRTADGADGDAPALGEILPAIPAHLDFLFADRPLLPGENVEQYDALLRNIVQQVEPADVIEALCVKDIVDLIWEAKRLRRWRGQILVQAQLKAVEELIRPTLQNGEDIDISTAPGYSPEALALGWVTGREIKKGLVDKILQERSLTAEDIKAQGFLLTLPAIERIDRLASAADQRRDALLREIERKRASFAQQVRTATAGFLDVEHTETR
ncbi:HNH endonuclease [Methylobacterium radiotolerans]|uniref:HNH nuclease n=1 Tax=Methylobacterium radiotolerans (strain ATCC 27329 / DSM 1819 / JCM 2831 / NBRC 15690 / NCIMB 10815 / 0-1) TaxID=426355 RepID=B1M2U3_METRJ|nr:HNH endonuclease [Methylobacterium radiotolerans]ACB23234.1 HNH nuclease [Methylobacterium radiotolerans JCM 2831]